MSEDRRRFLKAIGAGALATAFPPSIQRALALPAHHRTGTIADVEHIVVLMQENRSFDHYFGTLRGVRGFGDPRAVKLPSGDSVFAQPNGAARVLPFRPPLPDLGLAFLEGTPHNWPDAHQAWNEGRYDQWIAAKGTTTMAHLTRRDIPFHFALADAFTICDAYHCSFMGATDPNRYHLWTGWVGNDGKNGGPVLDNSEAGYDWSTFPERLERAGINWKIYQDVGAGLDAEHYWGWGDDPYIGNYGDNSLLYFHQYQNAPAGSPLAERARTGTNISKGGTLFDQFRQDVATGKLPQVSYIVAPEAYSEHPNWPPNYGAWYISQILDALTSNPEIWGRTALFLNYDENDGFFDHVVPPTPPRSRAQGISTIDATDELFQGSDHYASGPYGLGARVPMIVISPWSKGGWVNSEVFDHTSVIRFIEERFAGHRATLSESNITKWRRAVAGDLTSAFDFRSPNPKSVSFPSTTSYAPPDHDKHPDYAPVPPETPAMPTQERGLRPARAVPYQCHVLGEVDFARGSVELNFGNSGRAAAVFHVRAGQSQDGPWTYTVAPGEHVYETWAIRNKGATTYDLSVYGPNGFYRGFAGSLVTVEDANLAIKSFFETRGELGITLELQNRSAKPAKVRIYDAYGKREIVEAVPPGRKLVWHWDLDASYGWYDLLVRVEGDPTFRQQLAGHVETGRDSMSDPAFGA